MGWTGTHAQYYKNNGDVDRKAECDALLQDEGRLRVLKSQMIGSVYYAAVKTVSVYAGTDEDGRVLHEELPEDQQAVSAVVILTGTEKYSHWNFYYKEIPEYSGPSEARCPDSILDLLDQTEDRYADEWRQKCRSFNKNMKELAGMEEKSMIRVRTDGGEHAYEKTTGILRYPVWMDRSRNVYLTSPQAAETGYEILRQEENICLQS